MDVACVPARRDEFTNFMFLEKAQAAAGEGDADNWRLFPADFRDQTSSTSMHHEQVRFSDNRFRLHQQRSPGLQVSAAAISRQVAGS